MRERIASKGYIDKNIVAARAAKIWDLMFEGNMLMEVCAIRKALDMLWADLEGDVAKAVGKTEMFVREWMEGSSEPSYAEASQVAGCVGRDVEVLFPEVCRRELNRLNGELRKRMEATREELRRVLAEEALKALDKGAGETERDCDGKPIV